MSSFFYLQPFYPALKKTSELSESTLVFKNYDKRNFLRADIRKNYKFIIFILYTTKKAHRVPLKFTGWHESSL